MQLPETKAEGRRDEMWREVWGPPPAREQHLFDLSKDIA